MGVGELGRTLGVGGLCDAPPLFGVPGLPVDAFGGVVGVPGLFGVAGDIDPVPGRVVDVPGRALELLGRGLEVPMLGVVEGRDVTVGR